MAGGGFLPSSPVKVYNGHQTFYLWFCVLLGGAGGLLLGYDNGVMVRPHMSVYLTVTASLPWSQHTEQCALARAGSLPWTISS